MKLSEASRLMLPLMLAVGLLAFVVNLGAGFVPPAPFALGLLLGLASSVLRLLLMERAIQKALDMEVKQAQLYTQAQFLLRYLLTGAVLVLAALVPLFDLYGAIIGILAMSPAAYGAKLFMKQTERRV